ncbi:MAG: DUF5320 domain-containing protein [Caldisericia bacterium]|nr:DUF5320 domain-containing protein [Caldisericia bacterium]MDD4614715.1 DUF5320 domain-containing protein [Caldisericia bacterium]
MPGFNGTGPNGQGPMTGRGLGNCNPDNVNANQNQQNNSANVVQRPIPRFFGWCRGGFGRGLGMGRGLGRGFRNGRGMGNGNPNRNGR